MRKSSSTAEAAPSPPRWRSVVSGGWPRSRQPRMPAVSSRITQPSPPRPPLRGVGAISACIRASQSRFQPFREESRRTTPVCGSSRNSTPAARAQLRTRLS
ncbi:MAG: hypothetical protein ACKOHK_15835, partial [Planctomycetia bacterium]